MVEENTKCDEKPRKTHKRVTALDKGEGLTYLVGENQQAVHQPPIA